MHFEHVEARIDSAARALPTPPEPNWLPLDSLLGPAIVGQFMFMGEATTPAGRRLVLFKHGMTRNYLNVAADDLSTWTYRIGPSPYAPGHYTPGLLATALAHALDGAEQCGARPNVNYDADFRAKRDRALAAAGYRTVTAMPGRGVA